MSELKLDTKLVGESSFKNKLINGNFDFWQRGTTLASGTGFRYFADMWVLQNAGGTALASRQPFVVGQTLVPGEPTYYSSCTVTSVAGANNFCNLVQKIEDVRTLSGRKATVSFYAKADAAKTVAVEFVQDWTGMGGPSGADVLRASRADDVLEKVCVHGEPPKSFWADGVGLELPGDTVLDGCGDQLQ